MTVAVQTIEKTGKDWKVAQAVGAVAMLLGLPTCVVSGDAGAVVMLLGLATFIVGRVGAWWFHG